MTAPARFQGLQLEQAPPLSIPASFFLTAPVALLLAGLLLVWRGAFALSTGWTPTTLLLAHLGTLGFLTAVMFGALYQMTPVVAGSPVRRVRLAHAVHALLVVGLAAFVVGLGRPSTRAVLLAAGLLAAAVLAFALPVGCALLRAPTRSETVTGMTLAVGSLLVAAGLGAVMALGHGGVAFPGPRGLWIQVHLGVGLLGWVGGLISAVAWQVVPMFYLAVPPGRTSRRVALALIAAGVALPLVVLGAERAGLLPGPPSAAAAHVAALAALPAAVAVWGWQPALLLRGLAGRRRRRTDATLLFWRAGLLSGPLTGIAALLAHLSPEPRFGVLLGWVGLWGWAGMIVHGMLSRIVPFLVWFHRFSPLVGQAAVPSLRSLLPERWTHHGFALHLGTLLLGAGAILARDDLLCRLTGLALAATGAQLGWVLVRVLRRRAAPQPAAPAAAEPDGPGRLP